MDSIYGYLFAILIAFFLLRHTATYPRSDSCLPPLPTPVSDCCCNDNDQGCCKDYEHYYKTPVYPEVRRFRINTDTKEHFHVGPPADWKHPREDCDTHKFPKVDLGYTKPLYHKTPYSYAYTGRPYGTYRPWWNPKGCTTECCD